jgi:hypothetical protein
MRAKGSCVTEVQIVAYWAITSFRWFFENYRGSQDFWATFCLGKSNALILK